MQGTQWQRSIAIEMQGDVVREAWRDELPADARNVSCSQAYRSRQDSPAPNSKEVCATQLVDQGNGSAKVEETCYYEIYADYCKYNALEWKIADHAVAEGTDLQPYWPDLNLSIGQREGERTQTFTIDFETKDGNKQYTSSDFNLYPKFTIGSNWSLSINSLGTIVEVSP